MSKTEHKNIAAALAAFQADLPRVTLDGQNPHFKSKFASLANMSHVVLPALAAHGLSFTAAPNVSEHGFVLNATLLHESGDSESATFPIQAAKPQDVGSALTYYRRYALAALTGVVADDDDDGNTANAVKAVLPPTKWRGMIAGAKSELELTAVYQQASAEGWAVPEVMQALTARKTAIQAEAQDAAKDA